MTLWSPGKANTHHNLKAKQILPKSIAYLTKNNATLNRIYLKTLIFFEDWPATAHLTHG